MELASTRKHEIFKKITGSEDESPNIGDTFEPIAGLQLTYLHGLGENLTSNEWLSIGIGLIGGIPVNLLCSFIYDQLKNDTTIKLVINGNEIPLDEKKLSEILKIMFRQEDGK